MSNSTAHDTPHDLTRQLAEFAADRALHARFNPSAITLAEQAITDSIGCILAGIDDPAALKLGDTFPDEPSGASQRSSSVRHRHALSARDAAAVNACAGHARELDDNVMPGAVHSSIVLTPALFALGEEIGAPGSEVVRAFIVGQEVNTHIVELVDPAHNRLGWNVNSSIGVFGTAAACAALMRLDADRMVHALSLAFSMSSGTNLQFGSEAKPLHCGLAAGAGVWAAQLAAQGFRGHPRVFQGRYSFGALYSDAHSQRPFVATLVPEAPLAIDQHPPVAKLYPCCGSAHLAIEALLMLRQQHVFAPEHIERVDVHMLEQMVHNLQHDRPADEMQARFSLPYCAAVALVHGLPRLAHARGRVPASRCRGGADAARAQTCARAQRGRAGEAPGLHRRLPGARHAEGRAGAGDDHRAPEGLPREPAERAGAPRQVHRLRRARAGRCARRKPGAGAARPV